MSIKPIDATGAAAVALELIDAQRREADDLEAHAKHVAGLPDTAAAALPDGEKAKDDAALEIENGQARHDRTTIEAGEQEQRGTDWVRFAAREAETDIGAASASTSENQREERQAAQQISVADLIREQTIASGKIPS